MFSKNLTLSLCGLMGVLALLWSPAASWAVSEDKPPVPNIKTLGIGAVTVGKGLAEAIAAKDKLESLQRTAEAMDGQLAERFNSTRKFKVIARSDLDKILIEQGLSISGNVNPADPKAIPFKIKGLDYLLVMSIDHFQDHTKTVVYDALNAKAIIRTIELSAIGKLYDTTTGELAEATNLQVAQESRVGAKGNETEDGKLSDSLLVTVAKEMADRMANRVADVIYPAKVLKRTGRQVTINRGDAAGVVIGQVWNACSVGEVLKDPDTGEILGREENIIGKVTIVGVLPKTCTAEVVEEKTDGIINPGVILRVPPPPVPATQPAQR